MPIKRISINPKDSSATIRLRGARLSFPALFKAESYEGGDPKFGCTFLLNKEPDKNDNIKYIQEGIKRLLTDRNEGKRLLADKICLREGEDKEHIDGYSAANMYLRATSTKPVGLVDIDRSFLTADTGTKLYAGCYINATIRLWFQDNKFGKRINANLRIIQHAGDGEAFGDNGADPDEEFEDVDVDAELGELEDELL